MGKLEYICISRVSHHHPYQQYTADEDNSQVKKQKQDKTKTNKKTNKQSPPQKKNRYGLSLWKGWFYTNVHIFFFSFFFFSGEGGDGGQEESTLKRQWQVKFIQLCYLRERRALQFLHDVAEMTKPCISNFGVNDFLHFFFLVSSESDFVLTKVCMSIFKDVILTEPCNLHDLYPVLTAMYVSVFSWAFHFFEIQGFVI